MDLHWPWITTNMAKPTGQAEIWDEIQSGGRPWIACPTVGTLSYRRDRANPFTHARPNGPLVLEQGDIVAPGVANHVYSDHDYSDHDYSVRSGRAVVGQLLDPPTGSVLSDKMATTVENAFATSRGTVDNAIGQRSCDG